MFESLKSIFEILTNKTNSSISKIAFFLSILLIGLLVDFSLNLTYNYHINNKLNQIEKINNIKKSYSNNPEKLKIANSIENEIFNSEHYLSFINKKIEKNITGNEKNPNEAEKLDNSDIKMSRSFFHMFLSSGSLIFILAIIRMIIGKGGSGTALDTGYLLFLSIGLTFIFYTLPIIEKPFYNYLISFVMQFVLIMFILKKMIR